MLNSEHIFLFYFVVISLGIVLMYKDPNKLQIQNISINIVILL